MARRESGTIKWHDKAKSGTMKNDEGIAINSKINAGCRKINRLSLQDNGPSLQDNGSSLQDKVLVETALKQLQQRLKLMFCAESSALNA